jgi:hypothetical protein
MRTVRGMHQAGIHESMPLAQLMQLQTGLANAALACSQTEMDARNSKKQPENSQKQDDTHPGVSVVPASSKDFLSFVHSA